MKDVDISALNGRLLQIYCDVYDLNSVSRAAEKRGLNQSTVSYGLDRLRVLLGDPLFLKSGRNITPTDFTHSIISKVKAIVGEMEGLLSGDEYNPALDENDFRIYSNTNELLPELRQILTVLRNERFAGEVKFLELGSRENVDPLLHSGKADVVISVRMATKSAIACSENLIKDDIYCYYDPNIRGPVTSIHDYLSADHIVLDFGGDKKSTVATSLEAMLVDRRIAAGVSSVVAMAEMIKGTGMIATMQARLSHSVFAGLAYSKPPFNLPPTFFDLIWHRRNDLAPRNMWLRSAILQVKDKAISGGYNQSRKMGINGMSAGGIG